MQCREFSEIADSYLCDELMVETNHEVIQHLETCVQCRRELTARRELRNKLRTAFINAPEIQMDQAFAGRLRTQLRQQAAQGKTRIQRPLSGWLATALRPQTAWIALAACLLMAGAFGLFVLRQTPGPPISVVQPSPNENKAVFEPGTDPGHAVRIVKAELAESAAGDHRDCAVKFRLSEKPISLEEAGRKYDPVYLDLTKAVMSQQGGSGVPADVQFVEAHSCVFQGRRFGHIVLKYHDRLVSFLVTDLDRANEEPVSDAESPDQERQQVVACSEVDGFEVSCFKTAHHAVFVVSDLPVTDNLALARALAPSVYEHIRRTENGA